MHTPRNKMVSASHFAMVPGNDVPRSAFDVQHTHKTTFDAGHLVPIYVDEVLPGDSHKLKMTALCRLSTPVVPVMDNLMLESFFFFVPCRLLWANWERFMGEQTSPTDITTFLVPQVTIATADMLPGSLPDYFGITVNHSVNTLSVNVLPFRAYNLIYNEWFRDQDLSPMMIFLTDDGPNTLAAGGHAVARRGKRHDYFTSARPWAEKPMNIDQVPGVLTPLLLGQGMTVQRGMAAAPVSGLGWVTGMGAPVGPGTFRETGTRTPSYALYQPTSSANVAMRTTSANYPDVKVFVQDMRTAIMIQGLMEKNARGGTRYAELVRSHFRVISPDARLQRPEYLGGGRTMVTVNPVAQTSATGSAGTTTVLGELAGVGTAVAQGHGFSQSFTEHGYIIGLVNVRADLTYQQGVNRMWFRRTQFDFYWPSLAHLGEQAILSKEIYCDGSVADGDVFGFQERWAEYKYKPSRTSGAFRSTYATPLDMWHFGQVFGTGAAPVRPVLNATFAQDDPPMARVLQVDTNYGEQMLLDAFFEVRMVRPMPMFSIPGVGARL